MTTLLRSTLFCALIACCAISVVPVARGADEEGPASAPPAGDVAPAVLKVALAKDPPGMKRLLPDADAWVDHDNKRVVIDGMVCMREGQLEMLACLKGTKEYESLIAVPVKAFAIHAALLAVGAQVGNTVEYQPKFRSPSGTIVDITLIWTDENGVVHRKPAQEWVRDVKMNKALDSSWVFAGSKFWQDEDSGERHYQAEEGRLICVSNFPEAMLDLPIESTESNADLLFEALTENIPPKGTKVRMVLTPRVEKK